MKKLTAAVLCLCLSLCGCNNSPITEIQIIQTVAGEDVIIQTPDTMYLGQTVYAMATCPVSSSAIDETGRAIFTQSYQKFRLYLDNNEAQQLIEEDLRQRMDRFFSDALTIQAQARQDCFQSDDWTPYYSKISYTPERIDSAVISLRAVHDSYSGTVPNQSLSCVTYDTNSGAVLYLKDILEPSCTGSVLAALVNGQLSNSDGLYEEFQQTVLDSFSNSLASYSNWFLNRQGLCIQFSPYEISPSPVSTLIPYESLSGILRDSYFPEQAEATGSLSAAVMQDSDRERFSFTANVELDSSGTPIVIYPTGTIENLRVEAGAMAEDGSDFTATATVFATDAFYLGNALAITTALKEDAPTLRVSYSSGGQWVSAFVLYYAENHSILLAYG